MMSAWKEWQIALEHGDEEMARIAKSEYAAECRAEMHDTYEHEHDSDEDDCWD